MESYEDLPDEDLLYLLSRLSSILEARREAKQSAPLEPFKNRTPSEIADSPASPDPQPQNNQVSETCPSMEIGNNPSANPKNLKNLRQSRKQQLHRSRSSHHRNKKDKLDPENFPPLPDNSAPIACNSAPNPVVAETQSSPNADVSAEISPEAELTLPLPMDVTPPLSTNLNVASTSQSFKRPTQIINQTASASQSSPSAPPPIVLRDKDSWLAVSTALKNNNIQFHKAVNARDGINIYTATENDYRTLYKFLQQTNAAFHTYQLRSEKSLRVVMRGIIQSITTEQIAIDLQSQDYDPIKIDRLKGRDGKPSPLVVIEIDKKFKSIYKLEECCGLAVTIESKRVQQGQRQCHKCQIFGHTQANCHAAYKCMKCAEPHSTHTCTKPRTIDAKCSNCGGPHTSSHSSCPKNPNKPTGLTKSYSQAASAHLPQKPIHNSAKSKEVNQESFNSLLGGMLATLYAANPTPQIVSEFIKHSTALYQLQHK